LKKTFFAALAVIIVLISACSPKTIPGGVVVYGDASPAPSVDYASLAAAEGLVFITETGGKYHTAYCEYISFPPVAITRELALAEGYTPCSHCNPDF